MQFQKFVVAGIMVAAGCGDDKPSNNPDASVEVDAAPPITTPGEKLTIAPVSATGHDHFFGVTFDEAWSARVEADMDGLKVFVIGRAALIRNKRATGRPQDLADVDQLEKGPH